MSDRSNRLPNSMRWVVLYQGIMQAGAIPVPVNGDIAIVENQYSNW